MADSQPQSSLDFSARRSLGKYMLAGFMGVLITCLAISVFTPATSLALPQDLPTSADGLFAVQARLSSDVYGLYLIDTKNENILLYSYGRSGARGFRLLAARSFRYDRQLPDFNSGKPSPRQVRDWVQAGAIGPPGTKAIDTPIQDKPKDVPPQSPTPK